VPVTVNIEQLKHKASVRHYVEFTLGELAIAVHVKHSKTCVPFRPRDLVITILVKQFERHAANAVELQFGDNAIFVLIDHVKAFSVLGRTKTVSQAS
jgi:hypothetical protein